MPRRDSLTTVELVEADETDEAVPREPRPRSRKRWRLLAIPVAAAVIAAGVQLGSDALGRAADGRVAAQPGAIDPVGDSVAVLWQSEPGTAALAGGLVAHDALHGVVTAADGTVAYAAVDLRAGELLWSAPLGGPAQGRSRSLLTATCQTDAEPGTEPERVVCLVTDGSSLFTPEPRPATRSHVVVLDLADGHALADRSTAPVTSLAVLPGLAATAVVEDEHVVVVATDPLTGTELWRYREERATSQEPSIGAAGGLIVLFGTSGGPFVLSASGERVPTEPGTTGWGTTEDGWFVSERTGDMGVQLQRVVRPGEPPVEVTGRLLDRTVDDGSVPGLEVSTGGLTSAWDTRTGEQVWESSLSASPDLDEAALIIDGTAFLTTDDEIVALDARTGAARWTSPRLQGDYGGELLTDGAHVLLVEAPRDGLSTAFLTVLDRRDGTFVRRLALPDDVSFPVSAGRRLVGAGPLGTMVGLG